jgi:hypothetical protein
MATIHQILLQLAESATDTKVGRRENEDMKVHDLVLCQPSLTLAGDVGFTGLALSLQGIERLLQPLFGGFASVDGTSNASASSRLH